MENLVNKYTTFEKVTTEKLNRRKEKLSAVREQQEADKRDSSETEQTLMKSLREIKSNLKVKTSEAEELQTHLDSKTLQAKIDKQTFDTRLEQMRDENLDMGKKVDQLTSNLSEEQRLRQEEVKQKEEEIEQREEALLELQEEMDSLE